MTPDPIGAAIAKAIASPQAVPWVLAASFLLVLAQRFPGLMGPWSKAWEEHVDSRRRTAEKRDDADIADLRRQVEYLTRVVTEIRSDIVRRDAALHDHSPWDYQAVRLIGELGGHIDPPPPLWPPAILPPVADDGQPGDPTGRDTPHD